MTVHRKIKLIKFLRILLTILLVPVLLIYLLLIIPEYAACSGALFEGEKATDIWGATVDCSGENQAVSKGFFEMFTILTGCFSLLLIVVSLVHFNLKKRTTTNN